jgi:DNA-directed RNA polymerase specialized sigma24 family protein
MSYAEAAAALSIPVGTFKSRIRSALVALRAALGADDPTPETPR